MTGEWFLVWINDFHLNFRRSLVLCVKELCVYKLFSAKRVIICFPTIHMIADKSFAFYDRENPTENFIACCGKLASVCDSTERVRRRALSARRSAWNWLWWDTESKRPSLACDACARPREPALLGQTSLRLELRCDNDEATLLAVQLELDAQTQTQDRISECLAAGTLNSRSRRLTNTHHFVQWCFCLLVEEALMMMTRYVVMWNSQQHQLQPARVIHSFNSRAPYGPSESSSRNAKLLL